MQHPTCPSKDSLRSCIQGELSHSEAERLLQHVDSCTSCQALIDALARKGDGLLDGLRQHQQAASYFADPLYQDALAAAAQLDLSSTSRQDGQTMDGPRDMETDSVPELTQLRDYQLLAKIGVGGMGAVYKALHGRLEKVVAVKVLPSDRLNNAAAVARFRREMKAVGQLEHPNIVRATDAGEENGTHFLVMEYVEGVDLGGLVKSRG